MSGPFNMPPDTPAQWLQAQPKQQGWQCPVCFRVWAPTMIECQRCNAKSERRQHGYFSQEEILKAQKEKPFSPR